MVAGEDAEAGAGIFGRLEQAGEHGGQEEADMSGIGFKGGQLALLLVQAAFEGGPHAFKVGVGKAGQSHESVSEVLPCAQGGQDALDVGDGGEHLARLDLGDLALGDAAPGSQTFAGEASGFPGLTQGDC